jgi:hypothetical protein
VHEFLLFWREMWTPHFVPAETSYKSRSSLVSGDKEAEDPSKVSTPFARRAAKAAWFGAFWHHRFARPSTGALGAAVTEMFAAPALASAPHDGETTLRALATARSRTTAT